MALFSACCGVESGLAEHGLVVAGGMRNHDGRLTADCAMLINGRWRPIAPMSGPRANACSAIMDDEDGEPEMCVMGGVDGDGNVLTTVEAYSPRTNTWRTCLPLSQGRVGPVAGIVSGRLVVAGGIGDAPLTSVEAYSPTGWTLLPPMPHSACGGMACVLNGRLYVTGGPECNKLQVLELTEECGFAWSVRADVPAARNCAAGASHCGKLWVLGGPAKSYWDREYATDSVVVYDADEDLWAPGPPLPQWAIGSTYPYDIFGRATMHNGDLHCYLYLRGHSGGHVGHLTYSGGAWRRVEAPAGNPMGLPVFALAPRDDALNAQNGELDIARVGAVRDVDLAANAVAAATRTAGAARAPGRRYYRPPLSRMPRSKAPLGVTKTSGGMLPSGGGG